MKLAPWEPDLKTVVDRIDSKDIDLQPDFQRQEIWPAPKKRRLIDTIVRGWSVPPIFLVVIGDGRMEVLDGQQRLAAIRDFVHNDFSIDGDITPLDAAVKALGGQFYKTLPATSKRLFDQYTLRCFKLTDYRPDEPSELFYRLNQPSMLTAGEQRNAFFGPAREQLKVLVNLFESLGNVKSTIGFSNVRLAYDDIFARLLCFLEVGSFGVKSTEAVISQRFKERVEFSTNLIQRVERSIDLFTKSRSTAGSIRLNKASTLSWLLFFSRFDEGMLPHFFFMGFFTSLQSARYPSARVDEVFRSFEDSSDLRITMEAARLFQDRSSLRVTDVSSVVFRDFALWLAYTSGVGQKPPTQIAVSLIDPIAADMRENDKATLEFLLSALLDQQHWSKLL
jgi:hypothetical protein